MARKAGRPSENTQAREQLIHYARELFTVMPYDKVSTRLLAEKAGVNVAMIRYYFGNKDGLFETMVRETLLPMKQKMASFVAQGNQQSLIDLMRTYYKSMMLSPQFPKLVVQLMNMPPSDIQRQLLEKVFLDITKPAQDLIFDRLLENGVIRADMNPKLCRITFISLMIFPFIAPNAMLAIHGIELNETFLDQLLEHNIKVLSQGFIKPEQLTSGG